jgi:hypothetical protein
LLKIPSDKDVKRFRISREQTLRSRTFSKVHHIKASSTMPSRITALGLLNSSPRSPSFGSINCVTAVNGSSVMALIATQHLLGRYLSQPKMIRKTDFALD